jgi:hypothetical protein
VNAHEEGGYERDEWTEGGGGVRWVKRGYSI